MSDKETLEGILVELQPECRATFTLDGPTRGKKGTFTVLVHKGFVNVATARDTKLEFSFSVSTADKGTVGTVDAVRAAYRKALEDHIAEIQHELA